MKPRPINTLSHPPDRWIPPFRASSSPVRQSGLRLYLRSFSCVALHREAGAQPFLSSIWCLKRQSDTWNNKSKDDFCINPYFLSIRWIYSAFVASVISPFLSRATLVSWFTIYPLVFRNIFSIIRLKWQPSL